MVLGMLPVSAMAANSTGHKISVGIYKVVLDSSRPLGYQNPVLVKTITVTCTDGTEHSGYNHSVKLKEFYPDETKDWTGWQFASYYTKGQDQNIFNNFTSSTVNATANVTGSEPYPCSKNFYLVYKDSNPEVTYTLNYYPNTTDTVTNMPVPNPQTETSNTGTVTFTVSSAIPAREGYNFLGWNGKPDATTPTVQPGNWVTTTATTTKLYAVWQSNTPPTDKPAKPTENDVTGVVVDIVCVTTTGTHDTVQYPLGFATTPQHTIGEVASDGAGGYICPVTVRTAWFVQQASNLVWKVQHTPTAQTITFNLTYDKNSKTWVKPAANPRIEATHEVTPDKPGDQKPNIEEANAKIRVQCIEYPSKHNPYKQNYRILPGSYEDLGWDQTEYGYIYSIRLNRAKYIAQFDQEIGRPHTDTEPNKETRINWRWENGAWHLIGGPDGIDADIKVKCDQTETPPTKPIITGRQEYIRVICKNEPNKERNYVPKFGRYTESDPAVQKVNGVWTYTITILRDKHVEEFNKDFPGHEDTDPNAVTTMSWVWKDAEWKLVPVNGLRTVGAIIEVTCEPKAPTADELKKLEMAVQVKCVVDASQQHKDAYGLLGECDVDYFVGEPRKDGDDWLCDISYYPERYVAAFNTTFQNLKHVQNDEQIVPVTLIWAGGSWQLKTQGRVHVTEEYTVTYTDGVENEEVFADQVYSDLRKDSTTPAFNGTPTRTGYTFAGWEPEVAETVTANATYTAKWTPVEPTRDDIFDALNGLVTVTCINRFWKDGNKNMDCGQGQYAAKAGIAGQEYTLEKGENAGTWIVTFPVTNFVKSFKQNPAHHLYTKNTLSWYIRWENNAWKSAPVESGVDDLVKLTHAPTDWREVAKIATGGKSDCIHVSCVNGETGVCDYGITVPFVYSATDVVSVEPEDGVPGSYIATFKVDRYIDTCAKACNDKNFKDAPRTHKLLTQDTVQWRLYATSEADEKIGNNVLNHVWEAEPVEAGKDDVCTIAHNWVVTFNPDNGGDTFKQNVEYEGKAIKPTPDPEKTGYTFDGWYLDEAEEPFSFETTITSDITLKAKWHVTLHNIYAYARLNSYFAPLTASEFDTPITLNDATLSRLGLGSYNSLGYISIGSFTFDAMPLTSDLYFGDDAELSAVAEKLATDIALETGVSDKIAEKIAWTALYKTVNGEDMAPGYPAEAGYQLSGNLNLASVTFRAGAENVENMPAVNYTYDDGAIDFYDFYFAGDTYTITKGGVIFTAQWEARTDTPYTVEHYLENLDGNYALDTTEHLKGTTDTTVTAAAKSYDNFTYDSTVPGTVASGNIAGDGSLVLKLFYTRNTYDYTVRHIKQLPDGSYDEANAEVETLSGKFEALAAVTAKDYGEHYPTNDADTKQNIKIEKGLTIDVKYDLDEHTLTFETNGGSTIAPVTVRHGNAVARPADPTKDKYTFIGWYADPEFTEEYDFATVLEADKTIYAKFELTSTPIGDIYVRYDVLHIKQLPDGSYDLANAEVEHLSAKKDTTVTAVIKDYRATHHVNVNRTLSKLTGTAIQPYMGVDGKPVYTILSVYYDLDFHTLTFDTMGGSKIAPETVRHGLTVAKPKDPVNGGYIFDGWYTDKTFRHRYDFSTPLTEDITIYAKWFLIVLPGVTVKKNTPKLNTADHFAYVQGYPNGTVKPAGNITRAETAAILFRLMDDASRKTYYSTKSGFRDVASGSWYNTYVATLNNAGVITDSSNGYFRPNEAITRAELAAMLAKFSETTGAANYFNDVSAKYWAANAIAICAKLGWITGYPDGTFRPDKNVTRAELMAMINRATGRVPKSADAFLPGMKTWIDNTSDKWYYLDVQEATNSHSYTVKGSETWTALTSDPNWSLYE